MQSSSFIANLRYWEISFKSGGIMTKDFIQLIDQAMAIAIASRPDYDPPEQRLEKLLDTLQKLKEDSQSGNLKPANHSHLGLGRFVSDWVEPLNSPLTGAVWEIDQYYQQNL
jgi:hypothetical protein